MLLTVVVLRSKDDSRWWCLGPNATHGGGVEVLLLLMVVVLRSSGFQTGSVLECNLVYRRSQAELCMLFKIKSYPMHPLSGALPLPYFPARVTRGDVVAHSHSFAPPRCRTFNDLGDPLFDGVRLAGFKSRANAFLLA